MAGKEVAKAANTEVADQANLDAFAAAGAEHKETLGRDDMSIPFLAILQQLSPQCTKGKPEFIKGAEPSELFNSVTQKRFPTRDGDDKQIVGVKIVGIAYQRSFNEWVPRQNGGGFVAEHSVEDGLAAITIANDSNQDIIQEGSPVGKPGNQLSDTHTHYVFIVDTETGAFAPAVISGTSTQIKPLKDFNALVAEQINATGYARFTWVWDVTTQQRTNDQGSWYVWRMENPALINTVENGMEIFAAAKRFADGVKSGDNKADMAKSEAASGGDANPTVPDGGDNDDEGPF